MHHRHKIRQVCSCNRHTRGINMILEGTITELIIKLEPNLYRKHIWYKQKRKLTLCTAQISAIQNTTGRPSILEAIVKYTTGVGLKA